jgi:hypothetical protein
MMSRVGWPSGWTKPDVGAPTQPIGGVGHPTLSNGLGWVDGPVRRPNPIHSRGAHPLFEKKGGRKYSSNLMILGPKNQEIFFSKKKLFKKIKKIQMLYLIRLVSGSLGEPMG